MKSLVVRPLAAFLAVAILLVAGCGKQELSRSVAEAPVKKWLKENGSSEKEFSLTYAPRNISGRIEYFNPSEPPDGKDKILSISPYLGDLERAALITSLKFVGMDHPWPTIWHAKYEVSITDKGNEFLAKPVAAGAKAAYVRTSEATLMSITGVTPSSTGSGPAASIATFDWQEVRTAFGEALKVPLDSKTKKGSATFVLFDDGWRLERVSLN